MTDQMKELLWMTGCTSVMAGVGIIALVGYIRMKRSNRETTSTIAADTKRDASIQVR